MMHHTYSLIAASPSAGRKHQGGLRVAAVVLLLSAIIGSTFNSARAGEGGSLTIGAGYTRVGGYYSDRFLAAPGFRAGFVPMEFSHVYPDLSLSFSSYRLNGSRGSQLSVSGADIGAQGFYRSGSFSPFAGVSTGLRYFYFNGERTSEKIRTFKPAFGLRGGVTASLGERLSAELRGDYTLSVLSGERFDSFCVSIGVAYRFGVRDPVVPVMQTAKPDFYGEGLAALRAGQAQKSRELLSRIPTNDPLYPDALKFISEIDESLAAFNEGEKLIAENRKIEAIPPMEKASLLLPDAAKILQSLRNELRHDIAQLVKSGIAAYESKDYSRCISVMQKVLTIDPSNQTARTYYERAKKREEALKKLQ